MVEKNNTVKVQIKAKVATCSGKPTSGTNHISYEYRPIHSYHLYLFWKEHNIYKLYTQKINKVKVPIVAKAQTGNEEFCDYPFERDKTYYGYFSHEPLNLSTLLDIADNNPDYLIKLIPKFYSDKSPKCKREIQIRIKHSFFWWNCLAKQVPEASDPASTYETITGKIYTKAKIDKTIHPVAIGGYPLHIENLVASLESYFASGANPKWRETLEENIELVRSQFGTNHSNNQNRWPQHIKTTDYSLRLLGDTYGYTIAHSFPEITADTFYKREKLWSIVEKYITASDFHNLVTDAFIQNIFSNQSHDALHTIDKEDFRTHLKNSSATLLSQTPAWLLNTAIDHLRSIVIELERAKSHETVMDEAKVTIVHPSFCSPGLLHSKDTELSLWILADEEFTDFLERNRLLEDQNLPRPVLKSIINNRLKWRTRSRSQVSDLKPFSDPKNSYLIEQIFSCAYAGKIAQKNITLNRDTTIPYKWEMLNTSDNSNRLPGNIHTLQLKDYLKSDLIYCYHIKIQTKWLEEKLPSDGLIELVWTGSPYDDSSSTKKYICDTWNKYSTTKRDVKDNWCFDIEQMENNQLNFDQGDSTIENYHPVFLSSKDQLDIAQLSDVHVSSRHFAFAKSNARILPNLPKEHQELSPEIGSMVNVNYHTLKQLMTQIGEDNKIDILTFTGDLVDFNRNLNVSKISSDHFNQYQKLWEHFDIEKGVTDAPGKYPQGIDLLIVYSLFQWFYETYNKPILLVSGNHEGYQVPYGISPRVATQKANETIPMDHNLTFQEATLMFGRNYGQVLEWFNFDKDQFKTFFKLFTPMKDFAIPYGEAQTFIGLGWGDAEDFISSKKDDDHPNGISHLPRADMALDAQQSKLLSRKKEEWADRTNILLTHFTFINYKNSQPIPSPDNSTKQRTVHADTSFYTKFDYGTFKKKRLEAYSYITGLDAHKDPAGTRAHNPFIQYVLSGHSHRSAVYQFDELLDDHYISTKAFAPVKHGSSNLEEYDRNAAMLLVAASGGSIPIQNFDSLSGYGLARPSANTLMFKVNDGKLIGTPHVMPIQSTSPTEPTATNDATASNQSTDENIIKRAQPRFAAMLDAFDVLEKDKGGNGVFEKFLAYTSDSVNGNLVFKVEVNHRLMDTITFLNGIKSIQLIVYNTNNATPKILSFDSITPTDKQLQLSMFSEGYDVNKAFRPSFGPPPVSFLAFQFSDDKTKWQNNKIELGAYDFNFKTAWVFQVSLKTLELHRLPHAYIISRHLAFRDTPDFDWYDLPEDASTQVTP